MLLDVPGMRELKVAQLDESLAEVFADVESIAERCRFSDCAHTDEPGCAVRQAIAGGELDERRLRNYQKLREEEFRHSASLAEQHEKDRKLGKTVKQAVKLKRQRGMRQA